MSAFAEYCRKGCAAKYGEAGSNDPQPVMEISKAVSASGCLRKVVTVFMFGSWIRFDGDRSLRPSTIDEKGLL